MVDKNPPVMQGTHTYALQPERPLQWEALTPQRRVAPTHRN